MTDVRNQHGTGYTLTMKQVVSEHTSLPPLNECDRLFLKFYFDSSNQNKVLEKKNILEYKAPF